ncbi:MAG: C4-type zinc ribbon domain-containing protein [Elusimicrobiota bacterium]|jgi:predicted  nucleic acid-binding Zn-ribbon protein|nr:C4-type zinc ribbon domain-containing protein [Elusimicrobiota bacterium]
MENLIHDLEALSQLQDFDNKISKIKEIISSAPAKIEAKNQELSQKREEIAAIKKDFVDSSSSIKEQEAQLAQKEQAVGKYNAELNSVKTNAAYSALIEQINKAKADISVIEDKILGLLDGVEAKSAAVKKAENDLKDFENKIKTDISNIEDEVKQGQDSVSDIEKTRQEHKDKISKLVLDQYERIREGNGGAGLSYVENGCSCSVCGTVLRPQLLNQIKKNTSLVFCDGCSSILFFKS